MRIPDGCMLQIHEALYRAVNNKKVLRKKWKAFVVTHPGECDIFLYHYSHLILVYSLNTHTELFSWYEKPADKRGLDSARIWLKAYQDYQKIDVTCEVCDGTGQSSYGQQLWENHPCGKCNGKGHYKM